jgi:hypothetical protein
VVFLIVLKRNAFYSYFPEYKKYVGYNSTIVEVFVIKIPALLQTHHCADYYICTMNCASMLDIELVDTKDS